MCALIRALRLALPPTLLLVTAGVAQAQPPVPVSLKISRESAPAGVITQAKVFITEPKPITSGRARLSADAFSSIEGIALAADDAAGIAIVRGGRVELSVVSPSATFGTDPDYPVLTIAGRVHATAPAGARFPIMLDPNALRLVDPDGAVYPAEIKEGVIVIGGVLSVGNVIPGEGDLPTGAVVSIFGTGFNPETSVRLRDTVLGDVQYVSSNRIDVVLAQPARMRSKGIRVRNRDGAEATYFSYQRTRPAGRSAHPVLQDVVPVFADFSASRQSIPVTTASAGIALQNRSATGTFVFAELVDASGSPLAVAYIEVPSQKYVVRSMDEIFGLAAVGPGTVRLVGVTPIQALGIDVDARGLSPRLPR